MNQTPHQRIWHLARTLFCPIFTGTLVAQIIATWFVYGSNADLYKTVVAAQEAGYFVIPAGPVTASLTALKSAIWGGLFYTLSIGVGLTLLTWSALHLWQQALRRNKWVVGLYLVIWVFLIIWINLKGFALFPTLFCTLVPLATAAPLIYFLPSIYTRHDYLWMVPVASLVLLTAVWATQFSNELFTSIRDHILLSNPAGRAVNDFYYRYTLYAAQSFKSLNQKTIRTYKIAPLDHQRLKQQLAKRLARYDMLYLPKIKRPDFTITPKNDHLVLTTADGKQINSTLDEVLAKPDHWLQQLSGASDRYGPLRRITLMGLLIGFPILLYILIYGVLYAAICTALPDRRATIASSGICLVIGLLLFFPMLGSHPTPITAKNISLSLTADQWPQRVAALRYIEKQKIEIGHYPAYKPLLNSPLVVERYWLARALAASGSPASYTDLKAMLKDHHPNVICQVFYALGRRGNPAVIKAIQSHIDTTDHWYAQWYGYRALRRLGWYPNPLN